MRRPKSSITRAATAIDLYSLPADELSTYRARVAAVPAQQLQAAARKYLHPETLNVVISVRRRCSEGGGELGRIVTVRNTAAASGR